MESLNNYYRKFLTYLKKERGFSQWTINSYKDGISFFLSWSANKEYNDPAQFTKEILERYRLYLLQYKKTTGEKLCTSTVNTRLSRLRSFFKWLANKSYILYNPAEDLELCRKERRLPRNVLTQEETETLLRQPNIDRPLGIRDRAILETFYSTGIRKSELMNLKTNNIDFTNRTLIVKKGKWSKDRIIPIGKRAVYWLKKYINFVRVELLNDQDEDYLFLDKYGCRISGDLLGVLVIGYIKKAGIKKKGACHMLRHTMATHMLENGADTRFIQQMLGHKNIETTQIYTHVSIKKLRTVHSNTLPSKFKLEPAVEIKDKSTGIYKRSKQSQTPSLVDDALINPEPESLLYYLKKHLINMKSRGLSKSTVRKRKYNIWFFICWCKDYADITRLKEITNKTISKYQHYIYDYVNIRTKKPLGIRTKVERLNNIDLFFKYLSRCNYIIYNPAGGMELPRTYKHLPGNVLTEEEVNIVLDQPDISEPLGLRDRTILELLYSTGIRRKELVDIKTENINLKEMILFIDQGKGKKDRILPIGNSANYFLSRYKNEVRPMLHQGKNDFFFLNGQGRKIDPVWLGVAVSNYVKKANIGKTGGFLLFRHSMATRMLENGADIRFIQKMLGHTELKTTELYTHVSIKKLKEVHDKTHPAKLSKTLH
jgi:integrase/recombinase XerD